MDVSSNLKKKKKIKTIPILCYSPEAPRKLLTLHTPCGAQDRPRSAPASQQLYEVREAAAPFLVIGAAEFNKSSRAEVQSSGMGWGLQRCPSLWLVDPSPLSTLRKPPALGRKERLCLLPQKGLWPQISLQPMIHKLRALFFHRCASTFLSGKATTDKT